MRVYIQSYVGGQSSSKSPRIYGRYIPAVTGLDFHAFADAIEINVLESQMLTSLSDEILANEDFKVETELFLSFAKELEEEMKK